MEPEVLETDNTNEQPVENTIDPQTLPVEDLIHYEEELNELQNLSKTADNLSDIIQEGNEVGEEVYEKIEEAKKTLEEKADDIDPLDVVITQESIRTFRKRLGMEEQPLNFNFEDATSNPTLATTMNIEGFKEIGKTILDGILKAWEKLVDFFKSIFKKLFSVTEIEGKKANALKAKLNDPKNKFKEKLASELNNIKSVTSSLDKLENAYNSLDDIELHPIYTTLYKLFSYDSIGGTNYIPVLNTILADIPSIIKGFTNLIRPDVTREELGEYLEKAFSRQIAACSKIPIIDSLKYLAGKQTIGSKKPVSNICLVVPKNNRTYLVIATSKEGDKVLYKNILTIELDDPIFQGLKDIDKLATETSKAIDAIRLETTSSVYKNAMSASDIITKKIQYLGVKDDITDEARIVVKQITVICSTLLNAIKSSFGLYRSIYKRAETIANL